MRIHEPSSRTPAVQTPCQSALPSSFALPEPVDLEAGKVDLLLQVRQEVADVVPLLDGCGQSGLELRAELLLLLRRNQFGGFDQRRQLILDQIQRRGRNRGGRNNGEGSHHATSGCAAMSARRL